MLTPDLSSKIQTWKEAAEQLKELKAVEMVLRKEIIGEAFPDGEIGTNTLEIGNDWKLKGVYKITRKVDEAALQAVSEQLVARKIAMDQLLRWKPELQMKAYNKLSDDLKLIMDQALILKPASPSLELVAPKEK